jgi:lipoprotein-anchoring transpeptidase ErfK/SrfK
VKTRSFVIIAALVVLLLAAAGGVYAYDQGKKSRIAPGITLGGVDVGGLEAPAARERLRAGVLEPLSQPVVAKYSGPSRTRRFTLTPNQARVGVDIEGSIDAAIERSRRGNILQRTIRNVQDGRVNAAIDVDITYNRDAVRRLVKRVSGRIDRPARDAKVDLSKGRVDPQPSATGLEVRAATLRRDLSRALLAVEGPRSVRVRTKVVQPKVSTEQLAERYPAVIVVNRGSFTLSLYRKLKFAKSYKIAVGKVGLETPAGLYHVQNKAVDPAWTMPNSDWVAPKDRGKVVPGGTSENPLKARWLGIYDGAGIHGTDAEHSIGTAASHGCIRMRIPEVKELYDQVPVNAPVYIA